MGASEKVEPNFNFRLKCDGRHIGGVAEVSGLVGSGAKHEAITLKRGIIYDASFVDWLRPVSRRDVTIELCGEEGGILESFTLHRSWISKIEGPQIHRADSDCMTFEALTLQHEGCTRIEP